MLRLVISEMEAGEVYQRVDGQVYTPSFIRSFSGSGQKRPGINLEVVLGQAKSLSSGLEGVEVG
ncbi:hypothetical protein HYC85_031606 [Camellia sinensis]|uniref:Uncharacterized protein n=1 Tax=Camellia sinensis TaxID=4442 RepID=A0A7J7FQY8_CAMSI|nr:hypothetical protein HYC85_031606 [Camellia sinensis]